MAARVAEWHRLPVSLTELCIDTTLRCGQSFRWRKSAQDEWSCALHGRILSLRQDTAHLHYRAIYPPSPPFSTAITAALPTPEPSTAPSIAAGEDDDDDDSLALVHHYFNLGPNLGALYAQWAASDANFKRRAPRFAGVRILRQDPWEALISFICSSNNNISRISQMVHNLCLHYGPLLGHVGGEPYHDFPTPEALAGPQVEQHLQKLGFGYRAKYIYKTAVMVAARDRGLGWLEGLCNPESPAFAKETKPAGDLVEGGREGYRRAHEQLLALHGVGPKVADCVCLMGLGWSESVPVDTHVWQIAQRDYKFGKGKHSSLTAATYIAVGNHFRKLWGKEAGWAHSVLFTADLKSFAKRLVKAEVKTELNGETKVKVEPDASTSVEKTTRIRNIKRALVEDERESVKGKGRVVKRSKRRRT